MSWVSHPAISEILRVPGYLFWNPANLASEAGWGTKLGYTEKGIDVDVDIDSGLLQNEEAGEEIQYKIYLGTTVRVSCQLKNYNANTLAQLFPGMSSATKIQVPGIILPGKDLNTLVYTSHLLYVPDDETNNPIMILQKAQPNIYGSFIFSRQKDLIFNCLFDGFRKSNDLDGILYIGDITTGNLR